MNKNKIIVAVTIGIMSFIMIYVMLVQLKTVNDSDAEEIEIMRETELRETLASYKEKYEEINEQLESVNSKIEEYEQSEVSEGETISLMEEELAESNKLLGLTDVEGQGIIITMEDNDSRSVSSSNLLELVNELRLAGAEAISINDERIVSLSDIVDVGNFILVNGQRTTSPYIIKAIGDTTYLQSALSIKGGYIDKYTLDSYTVSIQVEESITIYKYEGELTLEYAN